MEVASQAIDNLHQGIELDGILTVFKIVNEAQANTADVCQFALRQSDVLSHGPQIYTHVFCCHHLSGWLISDVLSELSQDRAIIYIHNVPIKAPRQRIKARVASSCG
jgi:hypothetical protein